MRQLTYLALILGITACGQSGPDAGDIDQSLTQNVAENLDGCKVLEYSDVSVSSQATLANRPNVHQAIVSYDVQSFIYGHDLPSRDQRPAWISDSCWKFFSGGPKNMVPVMRNEKRALNFESEQDLVKWISGKTVEHVTDRTVNLQKGENGWQIVQ